MIDLRLCISILFSFQRRIVRDAEFVKETREWLCLLVAALLQLANWQDHLFIINHLLRYDLFFKFKFLVILVLFHRCPAGVGSWASSYIQTPLDERYKGSPFSNNEINHVIAVLALILSPILKRDLFLHDVRLHLFLRLFV